jgi:hypothetical protein
MADQQVYQILNKKSRTGKQNKFKTTELNHQKLYYFYHLP